jgi:phosphoserine phosphatase
LSGGDEKNQPGLLTELIKQRKLKKAGMAQVPAAYKKQPNHYFESLLRKDVNAAYTWRVKVLAGYTRNQLLTIAQKAYLAVYRHYVYSQMQTMIDVLHENKAIIHLVSAGPEILIKGCADTLGVPVERIHGQRFHVKNGKILPEIDEPHTYGIGKVWCIQNVVKPSPTAKLLVFGNSYSNDGFMLRYALRRGGVAVIINPADRKIKSVKRDRFMIQRFERKKLRALIFPKLEL